MTLDERYAASIPAWCMRHTLEDHQLMGMCWTLLLYVERNEACPFINCLRCILRDPAGKPERGNLV